MNKDKPDETPALTCSDRVALARHYMRLADEAQDVDDKADLLRKAGCWISKPPAPTPKDQ